MGFIFTIIFTCKEIMGFFFTIIFTCKEIMGFIFTIIFTVKPVYSDHLGEIDKITAIYR
jgi:hypothetical protein